MILTGLDMYGPYKLEAKIYYTDGESHTIATVDMGNGYYATKENLKEAMEDCEKRVKEQHGDEWHLCTKKEFFDIIMVELTGLNAKFNFSDVGKWDE